MIRRSFISFGKFTKEHQILGHAASGLIFAGAAYALGNSKLRDERDEARDVVDKLNNRIENINDLNMALLNDNCKLRSSVKFFKSDVVVSDNKVLENPDNQTQLTTTNNPRQ